ncbi:MAG: 23S rRNA (cytidine(2498)-2'-O)-methyltransferase RlmM [Gammaproteobacteria bacterium]|nr:23S rRNA (cytidine(2498)-2'-O)-methyltransferase RlmM [Gammaproteobacteria bacterium]MBU1777525.1 23S rRNA (cytidine(2498)-2'-O)-methyltransferase RlmM [Gammaproteobacteria bacterium]MBU1968688.1 23S rRNA (cytidine(2498)-2'-O)-methyltransferase RlmM [Gammaproteobacteria bacterium]
MNPLNSWLIYCRPGFERDCVEETQAKPVETAENSGFVVLQGKAKLAYKQLTFARQLLTLHGEVNDLPEGDRLSPLLAALPATPEKFGALYLEVPDTNEGKTLSGFTKRFQPLLEEALINADRLLPSPLAVTSDLAAVSGQPSRMASSSIREGLGERGDLPRLHIFFPDEHRALIASSDPHNSTSALNGIHRVSMASDAPSRSYLKLAEAFEVFLDKKEQALWLKPGMTAIDLGAAPGGWTWQLVQRGLKVTAVDNGPLKGAAAGHPNIKHLRQDGFRFRPQRPVDWLVCDMVEQPQRVAALMTEWFVGGMTQRAIFNLKLPMKKRVAALKEALDNLRTALNNKGIRYQLEARQLYHDREEVTIYLARKR